MKGNHEISPLAFGFALVVIKACCYQKSPSHHFLSCPLAPSLITVTSALVSVSVSVTAPQEILTSISHPVLDCSELRGQATAAVAFLYS